MFGFSTASERRYDARCIDRDLLDRGAAELSRKLAAADVRVDLVYESVHILLACQARAKVLLECLPKPA